MHHTSRPALLVMSALALTLSGCGKDPATVAAKEACGCLEPVYEKLTQAMNAAKSGDFQAITRVSQNLKKHKAELTQCTDKLKEKYGEKGDEFGRKVQAEMEKICPLPTMKR